jgi:hypothetical protein
MADLTRAYDWSHIPVGRIERDAYGYSQTHAKVAALEMVQPPH